MLLSKNHRASLAALLLVLQPIIAMAGEYTVTAQPATEYKAVFGRVESRDVIPARARIGGTIASLEVEAGTAVKAGDVIAVVADEKLALQLDAVEARMKALGAEMGNAETELARARKLLAGGIASKANVDTLRTQFDVLSNQLTATKAERAVLMQQSAEGQVLAPAPGRVLSVPVARGSVIMPGEAVARIASGAYFLRLSLPERHAANLKKGDDVRVGERGLGSNPDSPKQQRTGKLVKVYPEIEGGRVLADVEVDGLGDFFAGERTLVWIPVAERNVVTVPAAAISNRHGIDYVKLAGAETPLDVAVILGQQRDTAEGPQVEVLSGLKAGDTVLTP